MKQTVQNSNYAKTIKITNKMANTIMNAQKYLWTWLEGSVQVGKSVTAALAISMIIENSSEDENLFLALGYTVTSAKNNIFNCGGYGVSAYFGNRCEPCQYMGGADALRIYTKTGVKYLVAFGTSTKTANNAWHGWHVSGFIVDEIDRACEESIQEIQQRIVAVENPHIVVTQNPNIPNHPIYSLLDDLEKKSLVYYTHWVLEDNPALRPEKVEEVKNRYPKDSIWYKRYIEGKRCNPESQIYTIYDYNIIEDFNPSEYRDYIVVCDQGESISASVFGLFGLKYDFQKKQYNLDLLKRYYYINKDKSNAGVKLYIDTARDLASFVKECIELMNKFPSRIYIDIDIEFYRNVLNAFKEQNIETHNIKYVIKKDIESRIKAGLNLLYTGKLRFYNECKEIIEDFKNAVYDLDKIEKHGKFERLKQYNSLGHLDGIDCCEYAFSHYAKELNVFISE